MDIKLLTENDLKLLLESKPSEGKTLDYKEKISLAKDKDKKEFLADVSSFANASGGSLIVGIKEKDRIPTEICGTTLEDRNQDLLTIETIIKDGIAPRIQGLQVIDIKLSNGKFVLVIKIPKSWSSPHMITYKGGSKFFSRNSGGKYQLDVHELKSAFVLSESLADKIKFFRADRLGQIVSGETQIKIEDGPKLVVHLVPLTAFSSNETFDLSHFDLSQLKSQSEKMRPMEATSWHSPQYNFDGLLCYAGNEGEPSYSTLQIYRNGIIEVVNTDILSYRTNFIHGKAYERVIIDYLKNLISIQKDLGCLPPIFIMLSLLEVKNHRVEAVGGHSFFKAKEIGREELILPEVMIDDFDSELPTIMKPIFDLVWNASGWDGSKNYDENGKWLP